jgi:uncharacterized repeat protein (TIGR03803 family)
MRHRDWLIAISGLLTIVLTVCPAAAQSTINVLYYFTGGSDGGHPIGGLVRDDFGNLFGTTYTGGAYGFGTVYEIDSSGQESVLYSFTGGSDGANPIGGVVGDRRGNLYGTTYYGGASGFGTVFMIDADGTQSVLHSFAGGLDGANPYAGVIRDPFGNLYGTTYAGGKSGLGTVYVINWWGEETVLHSFVGSDGSRPFAGLISDVEGDLYGTLLPAASTVSVSCSK